MNYGEKTAPETFAFVGNVWRCLDNPHWTRRLVQLPHQDEQEGRYDVPLTFEDAGEAGMRLTNPENLGAGVRPER
jgi:hypothetical protein